MECQCPICGEIMKVAGLYFKTNKPDGELRPDGYTHRTTITCWNCNTVFVPHPQERESDK